ncbi:ferredoxin [Lentzea sp. NBRC 102530]|uniref:ferredoxin n=1 Tax=Lentzea sp. NBRC 102530 TaxID=3032201 RepID=UPI0024A2238C|nr:ferredoxin [Lentzea sp. NBRC 102530]GLY46849.1 hypothetical protein Lesp01_05050 [Lentzea sp. NBRC 102530]
MPVEVRVDRGRCRGLGLCSGMAPEHFRVTSNGYSVPLVPVVRPPDDVALVQDVARCCPMEAVEVTGVEHPVAGEAGR